MSHATPTKTYSRKTRAATYLLALVFAFASPFSTAQSNAQDGPELAGRVIVVSGNVLARGANGDRTLSRREAIYVGDTIFTDARSSTQIRMVDDALIALQESTEFAIVAYQYEEDVSSDQSTIDLIQGGFRTITGNIGQQNRDAYEASIGDFATIGIRGTDYEAVITPNGVFTGVYDGGTNVSNSAGSLDLGVGADFDFAQIATPNSPPVGLLLQPPGLGNIPFAATDEEDEESDEDENSSSDEESSDEEDSSSTDSEESEDSSTDESDSNDSGDGQDGQNNGNANGNGSSNGNGDANNAQSDLAQNLAGVSINDDEPAQQDDSDTTLNLETPTTELAAEATQAGTTNAINAASSEQETAEVSVNPSETSTDGSAASCATDSTLCVQFADGSVTDDDSSDGDNDADDANSGDSGSSDNNGNGNSANNGNGNGNSGNNGNDNAGNNGNGNGNNGNGNSGNNGNGNSVDNEDGTTTTTTVSTNEDGTTTTTTVVTITTPSNGNGNSGNNGNGNSGNNGNGNGNGNNAGDDDSSDDSTDSGDDSSNGNSGNNGNGNGNGNSAGDDDSSDDSTDSGDGSSNGNSGNNGNGNGNGNGNSAGDDDSSDDSTDSGGDSSDDNTDSADDNSNGNSGNNGNGNGNSTGDDDSSDDSTDSTDDNSNGNSGNNGNGNGNSGGDDDSSDDTTDSTDDNSNGNSGNNGNGKGNSGGGDDSSDNTTDSTDDNSNGNSGNNGNGNGNGNSAGDDDTSSDTTDPTSETSTSTEVTTNEDGTTTTTTTTVTTNSDGSTTTTITTVTTSSGNSNSGNGNGNGNSGNGNGNGNNGNGQTLKKPALTVDTHSIRWGRWNNDVDDNFVVIKQIEEDLVLVATSDYLAEVNPAPVSKLTGSHSYATTIASSFIGSGSAGDVSSLIAGMNVDFETGVIDQGTLDILVSDQMWAIEFGGSVNNGIVQLNATSGHLLDGSGMLSDSIDANLGGVFTGDTGAAFVGGFDLIDEINSFNTVNGLFTIER